MHSWILVETQSDTAYLMRHKYACIVRTSIKSRSGILDSLEDEMNFIISKTLGTLTFATLCLRQSFSTNCQAY
jgi:hypothetical protein